MADHEPGRMDITDQERTFEGFVRWAVRAVIAIFAALILLYIVNG